ncbi:MAG: methyltransferase [Bacteroidaceae bacterium]|nr:methyltransferase [Bacteroidaceae bacterium]
MSNDFFRFKQFSIRHDRCAMKVGTDGVLLGAWGCVEGHRILDVGTGTGLIALMAAQRNSEAEVLGIEIDEEAALQAQENIAESPFCNRVCCINQDVLTFCPAQPFDAILCNPPFFTEDTSPDDKRRALARSGKSLPFALLVPKVASLLSSAGIFSVIIPHQVFTEFTALCLAEGLHLMRRLSVQTTATKPPRRVLMSFMKQNVDSKDETLILMNSDGTRSLAYEELTKEFYLSHG